MDRRTRSKLETYSGPVEGSGKMKIKEMKLESFEEDGNSGGHLQENVAEMDISRESEIEITGPETSDRSNSRQSEDTSEDADGFQLFPIKKAMDFRFSSSNSSESSDIFQAYTGKVKQSETPTIYLGKPQHGINLEFISDESDGCSMSSSKSEKTNDSPAGTSGSHISDVTHESVLTSMSPTQSPPIQTMNRSGGYDPRRIPSSIFQRSKPTTPLEWSIASNESLFSINVGNNSFSREAFMFGESEKPGDSTKSGEFVLLNPPPVIIPPTVVELETDSFELDVKPKSVGSEISTVNATDGSVAEDVSERKRVHPPPVISWNSSSGSHRSNGSACSSKSFAFPIKKKCCACPSCYCSNCSWAFCYYSWPSCICRNCSRAFRYCWNCSRKGLCCHSSNTLADGDQSESSAADAKKKHREYLGDTTSSKSTTNSCCSCNLGSCCKWGSCCSSCRCGSYCSSFSCGSCCSSCSFGSCYSCNFGSCCCPSCKFGSCCCPSCKFGSCCPSCNCGSCSSCKFGSCFSCNYGSCCSSCNFGSCIPCSWNCFGCRRCCRAIAS